MTDSKKEETKGTSADKSQRCTERYGAIYDEGRFYRAIRPYQLLCSYESDCWTAEHILKGIRDDEKDEQEMDSELIKAVNDAISRVDSLALLVAKEARVAQETLCESFHEYGEHNFEAGRLEGREKEAPNE